MNWVVPLLLPTITDRSWIVSLSFCCSAFCGALVGAAQPEQSQSTHLATYTHVVPRLPSDSPEEILVKAASLLPNLPQRLYHLDEFSAFIHFGPNTFTGREWGSGKEDPQIFDPGDTLNTDQWCRAFVEAGMRKVILTVKHHDGFCLWQTRYNDTFSVRATTWRNGEGDVLRELSNSCKKFGLKLGIYLSPADLYQIENAEHGLYGNGSSYRDSIIPTAADAFHSNPQSVRTDRPNDAPTFTVKADDYNRYFMNQLYEVLTEYGPIHEVWFDGAHPKRKGGQTYTKEDWYSMIRVLAPEAAIFGGPDLRWCGNEGGYTRESEWSVLPTESEKVCGEDRPDDSPGAESALLADSYSVYGKKYESRELRYLIAEVNTSIRAGWFWRNEFEQAVRGADDVFDIYERAVGGNAGCLINIPPDNRGLIAPRDLAVLQEVGRRIRDTYGENRLGQVTLAESSNVADKDLTTYWQPDDNEGALILKCPQKVRVNRFVIQEAVFVAGQRIRQHALDAWIDDQWEEVATGTTIGFKKILRFPALETDRFRVRILDARLPPTVAEVAAHYYDRPPLPVLVTRDADQRINMQLTLLQKEFRWNRHGSRPPTARDHDTTQILYTLDGSDPTKKSSVFNLPFPLPRGGQIKARSLAEGRLGPVTTLLLGIDKSPWTIQVSSETPGNKYPAELAIDGDQNTYWKSAREDQQPSLIINLGATEEVKAITYLPPQEQRFRDGLIEHASIATSIDGTSWQSAGEYQFGNIVNDPTLRTAILSAPTAARFLRIHIVKSSGEGQGCLVGELDIFVAD